MSDAYNRADLEKLLAQDFGVTYKEARYAAGSYLMEIGFDPYPWWRPLTGNKYAVSEWIYGTDRYWKDRRKTDRSKVAVSLEKLQEWGELE